jgi:hypothetical protein
MLKYKLARGLSAGSTDVFPMQHQKYEPTRFEHNDAPSLLESVAEMRACRELIDDALSRDVPERIRARIREDADLFAYGESTVHFLNHLVLVDRCLRAGQEDVARQELAKALVYAQKLEADTRSTSSASAHANAANGLAASSAEAALRRFEKRPSPASASTTQAAGTRPAADAIETSPDDEEGEPHRKERLDFEWHPFPDGARFGLLGLHWFDENKPKLWRMPEGRFESLPKGVRGRCTAPAGGRIAIRCNTTKLALRLTHLTKGSLHGFDVYIDGRFFRSAVAEKPAVETELVLFSSLEDRVKDILVYLPCHQEVMIRSVGVDRNTEFASPEHRYARPLPVVFYGSSVCQGSGASKPGMTYEAILCRELNLDFVNLGFGGAGKAERSVVDLVNSIPACCYVFDLGKSYGMQDKTAYEGMLQTVRKAHPDVPIVCITPITSSLEVHSKSYSEKSVHTRTAMREAVNGILQSGEKNVYLIEGTDLLGFDEHDGLSKDGVHPSDHGFSIIARKLLPTMKKALGL